MLSNFLAQLGRTLSAVLQVGWDNTPDADHVPPGKFPPGVWINVKNPTPWVSMIASMTKTNGFIPIDPKDIARELGKLSASSDLGSRTP